MEKFTGVEMVNNSDGSIEIFVKENLQLPADSVVSLKQNDDNTVTLQCDTKKFSEKARLLKELIEVTAAICQANTNIAMERNRLTALYMRAAKLKEIIS